MLAELLDLTQADTKREAILAAIKEYTQRRRMARLVRLLGTFRDVMDRKELDRLRAEG